jgi:hypothetical protein
MREQPTVPTIFAILYRAFARWLFGFVEYIAVDVYGDRSRMKHELRHVSVPLNYLPLTCCLNTCLPKPKATGSVAFHDADILHTFC